MQFRFPFALLVPARSFAFLLLASILMFQTILPYNALQAQSANEWVLLGPMTISDVSDPSDEVQKAFFDGDQIDPSIKGVKAGQNHPYGQARLQWNAITPRAKQIFDLDEALGDLDFIGAYAYTEILAEKAHQQLVAIASDDAIKIWLNGSLVHEYWGGRALFPNEEFIALQLNEGVNTILVKVQDIKNDFGFQFNPLNGELGEYLIDACMRGNLEQIEKLIEFGSDVNTKVGPGITAYHVAQWKGYAQISVLLKNANADTTATRPSAAEIADYMMADLLSENDPAYGIIISKDGQIIYSNIIGYADVVKEVKADEKTIFRIGSVTKQFTAAAILKLQEQGKLSLSDKLNKYISDFPKGDIITLEQLLQHTSGIHSYTAMSDFEERVTNRINHDDLIGEIKEFDFDFEPGTAWAYNNSGYLIAGWLVEQISGMSFDAFLKQEFFKPLGMSRSGVYDNDKFKRKNESKGYQGRGENIDRSLSWDMTWAGGAGNIYSTLGDLIKWNEAFHGGKVLSKESYEIMTTPAKLNDGSEVLALGETYGMGLLIGKYREANALHHSGGLHGFLSNLAYFTDHNIHVAALTNNSAPVLSPSGLCANITEIFFPEIFADEGINQEVELTEAELNEYEGNYDYSNGALMTVRREGNGLMAVLTGQQEFQIYSKGNDEFFWKVVSATIQFTRDENGVIDGGMHNQGGASFRVPKITMPDEVQVDAALLAKYAGEYSIQSITLRFEVRDQNLWGVVEGQNDIQLFPKSDTEFFIREANASFEFITEEGGNVSKVILTQGGIKQEAPRIN